MADEPDLESWMNTVAHRVEFLELLGDEGPLPPRDIVDAVAYSRPTVTRALRELREADLVEQAAGGYRPTLAGRMAAEEYRRHETASGAIHSSAQLLAPIPEAHAPPVEALVGADVIATETAVPVQAFEEVSGRLEDAQTVRAYLPTLIDTHFLRVWHRAVVSTPIDSEAVFDPQLLAVLKGQYPHLLAEMAEREGFSAAAAAGPPYGLILTTTETGTSLAVVVYADETAVRGVLRTESPPAIEWAAGEFDRLASAASDVTDDLAALSAAVTDGMARSPTGRAAIGDTTPATVAESAPAAEGHPLPIDIESEGVVRLSAEFFDAHGQATPVISWRTGFTLAEVHAGYPVKRHDADGRDLTAHLVDGLCGGTDHVVLGPPGAGKSTVCMAVACAWYERELGPVLYRERGQGDRLSSTALLEAYLRQTEGHTLVVVEDAIRDEANAILEVMQTLDGEPTVTFLLDARTHEWREPDRFDIDARRDAYRRGAVEEVPLPTIDERVCERFVAHFADLVDADLDITGGDLFAMVQAGTAREREGALPAGDALVVQHYLAQRYEPPADVDASAPSALDDAVRQAYRAIAEADAALAPDLAVLVSLLTAAGVPVAREYLYAIADEERFAEVDEGTAALEGRLLFDPDDARASRTTYRTRHERWATQYLATVFELEPADRARERFGRCVTRLLALADEADRRTRIQRHLGGRTPHLHRIEADPEGWADEVAERVFGIGRTDASLAPLFGETGGDTIALPAACAAWTRLQEAYWRATMYRTHGDLARAEREFRTLGDLAEAADLPEEGAVAPPFTSTRAVSGDDLQTHRRRWQATSRTNLGSIATDRGDVETAAEYHREALELFRAIDDREGEAICLKHLGQVAFYASDYERASEYFEQGLATARSVDAREIEFGCLLNRGAVAVRLGDFDSGRTFFEDSLAIARELGERREQAQVLNNLGVIEIYQGAFEKGREYWAESLAIRRELGDRQGEADSLDNLGMVARKQGDHERAREFHREALAIRRDVDYRSGEATSLVNLGAIAVDRGALDRASERLDAAREIFEEIGEAKGTAEVRLEQGRVAAERGALEAAREHALAAHETFEELELHIWRARSERLRGRVAAAAGDTAAARDHWETALETFEAIGAAPDTLETLAAVIESCRSEGDEAAAGDWCRRAREVLAGSPDATARQYDDRLDRHAAELGVEG